MSYINHMYMNNQARATHVRYAPPPRPAQNNTTVIIQESVVQESKGSKTAAFFGGFLGALGSGLLGALNKAGETQATQQAQPSGGDKLNNLKALFPNYTFVSEGDDKYTVNPGDDSKVFTGTYEEVLDYCKGLQKSQGTKEPEKKEPVQKSEKKDPVQPEQKEPEKTPEHKDRDAVGASDLRNGIGFMVMDEERHGVGNITGELKVSKDVDESSKFPKRLLVDGRRYEFQSVDTDGKAIYRSSQGGQDYKAEWKNGQCVLTQRVGLEHTDQTGTADFSGRKTQRYTDV